MRSGRRIYCPLGRSAILAVLGSTMYRGRPMATPKKRPPHVAGLGKIIVALMKGTGTRLSVAEVKAIAPLLLATIPRPKKRALSRAGT